MFMRGVGRYASAGRRCDLAVRLSCRSIRPVPSVRSIFPYRLAGGMRAPFLSALFLASSVGGGSYRFTYRLVPRLACPSRGDVSWLFFEALSSARLVLPINSPGGPLPRLAFRLVASSRSASRPAVRLSARSCSRFVRLSRQAVRILSFRLAVRCLVSWCRVVFSVSFSSVLIVYRSLCLMTVGTAAVHLSRLVAACLIPVAFRCGIRFGDGGGGIGVPFDDTRYAPFSSARFLHQGIGVGTMERYG